MGKTSDMRAGKLEPGRSERGDESPAQAGVIIVSPLSQIHRVITASRVSDLVTLIDPGTIPETPAQIAAGRHLKIGMHDIAEVLDGMIAPSEAHVAALVAFAEGWPRTQPLLIHCWAGISRSTAAAFIAACVLRPEVDEATIASSLRRQSHTATPNRRLVALADDVLGRGGRMMDAIAEIGAGNLAHEAKPFALPLHFRDGSLSSN